MSETHQRPHGQILIGARKTYLRDFNANFKALHYVHEIEPVAAGIRFSDQRPPGFYEEGNDWVGSLSCFDFAFCFTMTPLRLRKDPVRVVFKQPDLIVDIPSFYKALYAGLSAVDIDGKSVELTEWKGGEFVPLELVPLLPRTTKRRVGMGLDLPLGQETCRYTRLRISVPLDSNGAGQDARRYQLVRQILVRYEEQFIIIATERSRPLRDVLAGGKHTWKSDPAPPAPAIEHDLSTLQSSSPPPGPAQLHQVAHEIDFGLSTLHPEIRRPDSNTSGEDDDDDENLPTDPGNLLDWLPWFNSNKRL
ncbi:hypothetical protein JX266_013567 [Neoarthrinium moseri]|nr:hypothetical protein JX266_013567 [Neoarthrinium moseri]